MKRTNLHVSIGILAIIVITAIPTKVEAQSRKRLKELERTEQQRAAEDDAAANEAKQRHLDIQSKQTRKEMKRYEKMSKRHNTNRREPFFKKWFKRNRR